MAGGEGGRQGAGVSRHGAGGRANVCQLHISLAEHARRAGETGESTAAVGTTIATCEVLIAGQALSRGLTLGTSNTRAFARVKDPWIEDWEGAGQ